MDYRTTLIMAVILASTLVVSTTGADVVTHQETDVLELEPAGEGTYTQIDDDTGEIKIIVTEENPNLNGNGVNAEAVTDLGPVFEIQNVLKQQRAATVWIDHSSDAVTFTDADGNVIQSESDGVELQPGDNLTVHMQVDTRGVDEVEIGGITVKATLEPPAETGRSPDKPDAPTNEQAAGQSAETGRTPEPTATATPTETPNPTPTLTPADEAPDGETTGASAETETQTPTDSDNGEVTGEQAGFDISPWFLGVGLGAVSLGGVALYRYRIRALG